jgi:hypothetical protein
MKLCGLSFLHMMVDNCRCKYETTENILAASKRSAPTPTPNSSTSLKRLASR